MNGHSKPKPIYLSARRFGHQHCEAFMLMWYACEKCGHRELIWNSRDGVTPFGCRCPSCGDIMRHEHFQRDVYAPEHKLHHGQRFWRDGTPDEAEAIMRTRLERMKEAYPTTPEYAAELIAQARSGDIHEFQAGWPILSVHQSL